MNEPALQPSAALIDALRREASGAPESGIVEVANYGRGRQGLIPLWVGESDIPTPSFISEPSMISASTRFFAQPREIKPTRTGVAEGDGGGVPAAGDFGDFSFIKDDHFKS